MEKFNFFNNNSKELGSDIHNVYKLSSNDHQTVLEDNKFLNVHNYKANQSLSCNFRCSFNNIFGVSKFKLRDNYVCEADCTNLRAIKDHQSHIINYTRSMIETFNENSQITKRTSKTKFEHFQNNISFKDFNGRKKVYTKRNNDVYHFYSLSGDEKHVDGRSIREFLSSWNDYDDDDTINGSNHLDETKIIKKQLLNSKTKKACKQLSHSSLQKSFVDLCQQVSKISLQHLTCILRTSKSIYFARYLITKYKNQIKCLNKRQKVLMNTIKTICRYSKHNKTKKPNNKKNYYILKYFLNKVEILNKRPLTLYKTCKNILSSNYNLKIIRTLSNIYTTGFHKTIVIIEENINPFPGLEPVCCFTEIWDENSAWFRKNLLREKYKNRIFINKKHKKEKQLKHCK